MIKKKLQEQKKLLDESYSEFYEKLKNLKISIIPLSEHGYFSKKFKCLITLWDMQVKRWVEI